MCLFKPLEVGTLCARQKIEVLHVVQGSSHKFSEKYRLSAYILCFMLSLWFTNGLSMNGIIV